MSELARRYHIDLFYSEDDNCWIANVPDLKYCSAHGDSLDEAAKEIGIAMELWLEGWMEDFDEPPPVRFVPERLAEAGS